MRENYSNQPFEGMISEALRLPEPRSGFKQALQLQLKQHTSGSRHSLYHPARRFNRAGVVAFIAIIIVFASLLAMTNSEIVSAMQRLFRFLPGIGLVETSQFKVLAEEETLTRDGISVAVKQAAGDAQRTRILLEVEGGLLYEYNWENLEDDPPITNADDPFLILPDQSTVLIESAMHHGDGSGNLYIYRLTFPPLPENVMQVTLAIPRIMTYPPGIAPENWLIPIQFKKGDPTLLDPVFEVTDESKETFSVDQKMTPSSKPGSPTSDNVWGVTFNLERVAELENGYIFMTETTWEGDAVMPYGIYADLVSITDANGENIPWDYAAADQVPNIGEKVSYSAFLVKRKGDIAWPLTLKANIHADIEENVSFSVDVGDELRIGENLPTDLTVSVPPYSLRVVRVEAVDDGRGGAGYQFTMESNHITRAMLVDLNNPREGAGGGGGGGDLQGPPYTFSSMLNYFELPHGVIEIGILSVSMRPEGVWQITWQPE